MIELYNIMEKYFINKHDKPLNNDYWDDNVTDCSLFKKLNLIDNNTEELNNNGYRNINKNNKPNIDLRKNRNGRRGQTIRNNKKKEPNADMLLSERIDLFRKSKDKM